MERNRRWTTTNRIITLIGIALLFPSCVVLTNEGTGSAVDKEFPDPPTKLIRSRKQYAPRFENPEDTEVLAPARTDSSRPPIEELSGGRSIRRIPLPPDLEFSDVKYRWNAEGNGISLIYSRKEGDYFQLGEKLYGPFHKIQYAGTASFPGDHFYIVFNYISSLTGDTLSALCLNGRVYPFGSADSSWDYCSWVWKPELRGMMEKFLFQTPGEYGFDQFLRAGRKIYGPFSRIDYYWSSPDYRHWYSYGYKEGDEKFLIIDGQFQEEGGYREVMPSYSYDRKQWAWVLTGEERADVFINGELHGSYDQAGQVRLAESGRFSFRFERDGKTWFNVNGEEVEMPGAMEPPAFLRNSDEYCYRTGDNETKTFYMHLGDRKWGPYNWSVMGSSRWTGESWISFGAVSYDGRIFGLQYQPVEEKQFVRINDETFGPFWTAWGPYISPDGEDVAFRYTDYDLGHWVWWNGKEYGPYTDTGSAQGNDVSSNPDFITDSAGRIVGFRFNSGGTLDTGIHQQTELKTWGILKGGENYIHTGDELIGPYDKIHSFWRSADRRHTIIEIDHREERWVKVNLWSRGPDVLSSRIDEEAGIIRILYRKNRDFLIETIPLELTLTGEASE